MQWLKIFEHARRKMSKWFDQSPFFTTPEDGSTLRRITAYQFESDMTRAQMLQALNEAGPWQWEDRDTVWYNDELSTFASANAVVRIYDEGTQYSLSYFFKHPSNRSDHLHAWTAINDQIQQTILPTVGARDVRPTSPHDAPAGWWRAPAADSEP